MNLFAKIGIGTALLATLFLVRRQLNLLYAPKIKIIGGSTGSISMDKFELYLDVEVFNNSGIGFEITGYDFDAYLNNMLAAKVRYKEKKLIAPKSSAVVTLKIITSPVRIFKLENLPTLLNLLNPAKLMVKVKGVISAKAGILNVSNIPIDFEKSLADITKKRETV